MKSMPNKVHHPLIVDEWWEYERDGERKRKNAKHSLILTQRNNNKWKLSRQTKRCEKCLSLAKNEEKLLKFINKQTKKKIGFAKKNHLLDNFSYSLPSLWPLSYGTISHAQRKYSVRRKEASSVYGNFLNLQRHTDVLIRIQLELKVAHQFYE